MEKKVTYTFGVMSTKYELEASSERVADVAIIMFMRTPAPVAVYEPVPKVINWKTCFDVDDHEKFILENRLDIQKAYKSIKKLL